MVGEADVRRDRRGRGLYTSPSYYHIAFEVNRKAETDFLEACFGRYARGPVRHVMDLACGTGHHALRLARRGYRVSALDLSAESIAFLERQAAAAGVAVEATVADMTAFRLPAPADAAICMQDSQGHLLTNEALVAHLRAVGANLRAGGVYIFDRLIPTRWAGPALRWAWTRRRRGITVRTTFRTLQAYDPVQQICDEVMRFEITENGTRRVVTQRHKTRIVFPQELRALVELAGGFEFAGWFSNFSLRRPLERARGALMMIPVLRRV
ncbi:MAG TPA: class I SAM-dependent methyltransferase [Methylomirabilota bacterium]|jgi:SAM-dependent methyltransferase|nr:class I SAM-dependent methyltransferase [Methylomirabilota bacterium]